MVIINSGNYSNFIANSKNLNTDLDEWANVICKRITSESNSVFEQGMEVIEKNVLSIGINTTKQKRNI